MTTETTLRQINELDLSDLEALGLDEFNSKEYVLDMLSHETVNIAGLEYDQGEALLKIDPIAFRQLELDCIDNLVQDELIEETQDGEYVWVQDVDLEELGLELNS